MKKIIYAVIFSLIIITNLSATDTAVKSLGVSKWMTNDAGLAFEMFPQLITAQRNMVSIETNITDTDGWLIMDIGAGSIGIVVDKKAESGFTSLKQSGVLYGWRNYDFAVGGGILFGQKDEEITYFATELPFDIGGDRIVSGDSIIRVMTGFSLLHGLPLDVGVTVDIPEDMNHMLQEYDADGKLTEELEDSEKGIEPSLALRLKAFDIFFAGNANYLYENDLYKDKKYTLGSLTYYEEIKNESNILSASVGASKTVTTGNVMLTAGIEALLHNVHHTQTSKDMLNNVNTDGMDESVLTYISPAILYLGMEIKLAEFFKVRLGMNKDAWSMYVHEIKDKDASGAVVLHTKETKRSYGDPKFSAGVGFNAAGAEADILVSNDLIKNGPNVISGLESGWMTKAGVSYSWE